LINLAAPWGRVGGRELAQLNNKIFSIINGSFQPIWSPPRGVFWGGEVPNLKNVKVSQRIFHFDWFGLQIGPSELSLRPTWQKMKVFFTLINLASKSVQVNFHFNWFGKKWKYFHFDQFGLQIDRSEFSLWRIWQKMKEIFHFDLLVLQIGRSEFVKQKQDFEQVKMAPFYTTETCEKRSKWNSKAKIWI
jgi:hypothetical protein